MKTVYDGNNFGNETYPFLYTSHVGLLQIKK